eukprot:CAMPEP_0119297320 /NCGR_PEP_ID=MMETSP1329-20130426/51014_1 /TAXON_ID=114041 /ORGANISM="Genus nov. species nov., Strain RCC1024" /LENGTH=436 /DNA_ID=CAMNT_0007298259 /DNA_START=45 /DNA_END=1352 /DNA_ORIENTATION=+
MKIKVISRSAQKEARDVRDRKLVRRNLEPGQHPFAAAREYQRAVVAAKLDRMMAKPFVCALEGHADALTALAAPRRGQLIQCITGGADGEVRAWDLAGRKCAWRAAAHASAVTGVALSRNGASILSCGERSVKRWALEVADSLEDRPTPLQTWTSGGAVNDVDASWSKAAAGAFATAGAEGVVAVWDAERTKPTREWRWGSDSVFKARWNPAEPALLAATSRDRAATLYDARQKSALRRCVLRSPCRGLAWNPRDPTCFVVGGEDHLCYTFDVRNLKTPKMIHEGHVGAVVDVAFAPTGLEFATASQDRTCRIFPSRGGGLARGRSRDCYHGLRMQQLQCVRYTADATFLLTASEDFNLRVWKARASQKLGPVSRAEKAALDYRAHLLDRHKHMPTVKRIALSRNLPKMVKKLKTRGDEAKDRARAKLQRRMDHSR